MNPGSTPPLSVVMPVYNGEDYLHESIHSIVVQTFGDFEFVIFDDGSTDGTPRLLRGWAERDRRIRVVTAPSRLGVVASANRVVAAARAPVCARMDADDVSHPDRLRQEWAVLAERADVSLVGTLAELIDARGRLVRARDRSTLLRAGTVPPFPHGSIMFRRAAFEAVGGYRPACAYWEDRDLFIRIARAGRILVLPAALYQLRCHAKSVRLSIPSPELRSAFRLMQRCLAVYQAGGDYTPLLEMTAPPEEEQEDDAVLQWLNLIGSLRLWAGRRPGILPHLWTAGGRRLNSAKLRLLPLGLLGEVSPDLYRRLLRGLSRRRDRRAGSAFDEGRPVGWPSG